MVEFIRFIIDFLKEKDRFAIVYVLMVTTWFTIMWVSRLGDRGLPEFACKLYFGLSLMTLSLAIYLMFGKRRLDR